MNLDRVRPVVEAALYEGYILYPYRSTSTKNRQRWTFGGIYPRAYFAATDGGEPCHMQTQCLVEGDPDTRLEVRVRFLHPVAREVGELEQPLYALPEDRDPDFRLVPSLKLGDRQFHSWQEAMERDVAVPDCRLGELLNQGRIFDFSFSRRRDLDPITDVDGRIHGVLLHTQTDVEGRIELTARSVTGRVYQLTVRIENHTAMDASRFADRDQATLYAFASTHTILGVENGAFVSLMDPPPELKDAAAACDNQGAYPVLVGQPGARDTLLSSPIILYDYPEVAPESPGNLYDATEIDELLSLSILAMTDTEKCEMAATDPRAASLLARTEALGGGDFMRLHGAFRPTGPIRTAGDSGDGNEPEPTVGKPSLAYYRNGGTELKVGEHVRLHPGTGGDVMDLVLAGRTAVIEAIERDFEDRVHVAVTIDDDPGREWGLQRMPGHRFFFAPEDLESLEQTA